MSSSPGQRPKSLYVTVLSEHTELADWQSACLAHLRGIPGVVLSGRLVLTQSLNEAESRKELANADIALSFCRGALPSWVIEAPRLGVWSFHVGQWKPLPPARIGMLDMNAVASAALVRLSAEPGCAVLLREGFYRPAPKFSATLRSIRSHCARWPAQVCIDMLNGERTTGLDSPAVILAPPQAHTVKPWRLMRDAFRELTARISRTVVHEHWSVGLVRRPIADYLNPDLRPEIHWFAVDGNRAFAADPFGIAYEGRHVVLYERYDRSSGCGGLSSVELTDQGFVNDSVIALGPEVHRSYPYVFEHAGAIYAIPETSAVREVALYRAEKFPERWTRVTTLLADVDAVDSTVFRYNGLWWLACCSAAERDRCADLFFWHADALEGPWRPHANNPVKSDVRSARPGGTPFIHEGAMYRPAQDCSRTYGGRIVINRILRLSPTAFEEEPVGIVAPDPSGPYPDGLHTLSALGDMTLLDGKRRAVIPAELLRLVTNWRARRSRTGRTHATA